MLKGCTTKNFCFIIIDVHEITTLNQTVTPVTPTQVLAPTKIATQVSPTQLATYLNVQIDPNLGTTSTISETPHAARTLTYDTTGTYIYIMLT